MKLFFTTALVFTSLTNACFAGSPVSQEDLTALQATMQSYISQSSVNGAILNFDFASGQVTPIYPGKSHPMIMSMGDNFVLCSEFRDETGQVVNADFYITRDDAKFVVFAAHYGPHPELEALMSAGKVAAVN